MNCVLVLENCFAIFYTVVMFLISPKHWYASLHYTMMTYFSFFSIILFHDLLSLHCCIASPIVTILCGVGVIFYSIIIYFTCCTDACFINFLLYTWTVCFFHQKKRPPNHCGYFDSLGKSKLCFTFSWWWNLFASFLWNMENGCTWLLGRKEFVRLFLSVS